MVSQGTDCLNHGFNNWNGEELHRKIHFNDLHYGFKYIYKKIKKKKKKLNFSLNDRDKKKLLLNE